MSGVLEKTLSGLVHSVFGASSSSSGGVARQGAAALPGLKNVSLGLIHFVEKLQAAQRISKQEEEHCVERESREWVKLLSSPGVSGAVVADVLCRALVVAARGYSLPSLHIHAIKLTQSTNIHQKKIGYLFVSQSLGPGSELTLLLVNTIQRDLAAPNALHVAASLASLPTVLTPDLTPSIILALTHCLAHQQVYIRRRAAAMVGVAAVRCGQELQELAGDQVPHLLHLLTDQDPAVALAAVSSLAKVFKMCGEKAALRDQLGRSASHLLVQSLNGALPKDYQVNALPAPFVQIQMLRVLQQLSSKEWQVPEEVVEAVQQVLGQPWGGKEMALYAVLLECVFTVTALPHHDELTLSVLRVVLGFLKSSNVDLKYVGLKALANVFSVLEEALTPGHLEAVLDCLYHSDQNLQAKTLKLLCSMANVHNYQAVCTTLLEFSGRIKDEVTQKVIVGELATIIGQQCRDAAWCVGIVSPVILAKPDPDKRLIGALIQVMERGFQNESCQEFMEASQELLLKVFSYDSLPETCVTLVASVLNLHYGKEPRQVSKYFTDTFLKRLKDTSLRESDTAVFQCLKNIGLNDESVCPEILSYLGPYAASGSCDAALQQKASEICRWLTNPKLSMRIIQKQEDILNQRVPLDLTLSFLDGYVVESLEHGAAPYKPFTDVPGHTMQDGPDAQWGSGTTAATTSTGSEDAHSSSSVSLTFTSHGSNLFPNSRGSIMSGSSLVVPSRRVWSTTGRICQASEGEELNRSRCDPTAPQEGLATTLLRAGEEEDEDEVTEGSVELADEAQEDQGEAEQDKTPDSRSQLTQALLAGLGMARIK
ncbi:AP-4 complex subunit epsilon-1-like isoform X1 [Portunus trituberculatus]|uniref:AP-4 complex subunit epsilon-1-like isoform X1 n=1 Tax=Portunus trituberculatus TaxID=210409 RepID=UPI001E1D20C2|nr:AP-4 complex subunit epsilon-1-like isoform X1 [Portunus trituberculatus]